MMDGEESPESEAALNAHLRDCIDCVRWMTDVENVIVMVKHLPPVQPPNLGDRIIGLAEAQGCGCQHGLQCTCSECLCGDHCTCRSVSCH